MGKGSGLEDLFWRWLVKILEMRLRVINCSSSLQGIVLNMYSTSVISLGRELFDLQGRENFSPKDGTLITGWGRLTDYKFLTQFSSPFGRTLLFSLIV